MRRFALPVVLAAALAAGVAPRLTGTAAAQTAAALQRKLDLIQRDKVPPGSNVIIGKDELNAYVRKEITRVAPQGVRDPRLDLGTNRATGYAYIDFPKLRRSQGKPMGWLMSRLLAGERRVRVDARIRSGGGKATVDVDSVQISGVTISGGTLDYLIRNFVWSYYPEAKIGRPFELAHRIDRLDVRPSEVQVVMNGKPRAAR